MKASGGREVYGFSGGPLTAFREGWAIIPFMQRPHFWRRYELTRRFKTLCGVVNDLDDAHPGITPLAPGDFMAARCATCARIHSRAGRFIA